MNINNDCNLNINNDCNFLIEIKYNNKNDDYYINNGYVFECDIKEMNMYKISSLSKKVQSILSKIRNNNISIKINLNNCEIELQIANYINLYVSYYNLTDKDNDSKIKNINYVNSLHDNITINNNEDASILYDFYHDLNQPNSTINPSNFINLVKNALNKYNVDYKICEYICDETSNFRAIYSVGKSGQYMPRFIIIDIISDNNDRSCLIGKGITFDTGGVNIKPYRGMLGMHKDKAGALFALYTAILCYKKYNIGNTVLLAVAENKINSRALCPLDIVKNYANKFIQIEHTDAEGRVVLSDCISYACDKINFKNLFTFATLTGTAECILGPDTSVFMTNNNDISNIITNNSYRFGERTIRLPLDNWLKQFIQFNNNGITGIKNSTLDSYADTALAGMFLYEFFDKKSNFIHVDIAPLFDTNLLNSHSGTHCLLMYAKIISLSNKI